MKVTVKKLGDGTENNAYKPDTDAAWWVVIEEKEAEFVIEIKQE